MTKIKIFRRVEGCEIPNNAEFLLVIANDIDAGGEWL